MQPSQRPSYRYLRLKIHSEASVTFEEILEEYWEKVPEFIGLKDFSDADAWLIKNRFDQEDQKAVLRVKREYERDFEAALSLIESFDGKKGFVEVEKVSGSISSV